jgi:hypothetical protein
MADSDIIITMELHRRRPKLPLLVLLLSFLFECTEAFAAAGMRYNGRGVVSVSSKRKAAAASRSECPEIPTTPQQSPEYDTCILALG